MNDDRIRGNFTEFDKVHSQEYCSFDFFVKQKELEQLKFDFRIRHIESILNVKLSIRETRSVSLQTLLDNDRVPFTNFPNEGVPVETDVIAKRDVEFRNGLCDREQQFAENRKKIVFDNTRNKLGITKLTDVKHVPNIAVIGSGGGMRAVIGMCGAMTALKKEGILDSTMYIAGVSGSAWYLLALFANDKEKNPIDLNNGIRKRLQKFRSTRQWRVIHQWNWMVKRIRKAPISMQHFTITHTFGYMIRDLLNEKFDVYWSDQADKLKDGSVPLPLVAALVIANEKTVKEDVGKKKKKQEETTTTNVQDETTTTDVQDKTKFWEWIEFSPFEVFMPKYGAALDMKKFGDKMYGGFCIDEFPEEGIDYIQDGGGNVLWRKIKVWIKSMFKTYDVVAKVPNILRGITDLKPFENNKDPNTDITDVDMILVDAGIAFNSPYPTVLHPSREVDIIISFDFTFRLEDHDCPFGELEKAEKWANHKDVPFPDITTQLIKEKNDWQNGKRKEVYVFKGDNVPTIVHFVLINKSFRELDRAKNDFNLFPSYDTLLFHYSEQDFDKLNMLVQHNVSENKKEILCCINDVIDRKQTENQKIE